MFGSTKYIVVEGEFGMESIFIFPYHVAHADAATGRDVISAGFLSIQGGKVNCFGESISLDMKSRGEEDTFLASRALGLEPGE